MKKIVGALIAVLISSCQIHWERPLYEDYAAWSSVNRDGTWTHAAETAVSATSLADQVPKDVQKFCPGYSELDTDFKIMFWAGLLSAMAKYESNFNPSTKYTERIKDKHGNSVVSRGLLQISIESANLNYSCKISKAKDLHDPATNLSCGARILSTWVELDGVVAYTDSGINGGARYWSVLRPVSDTLPKISAITRKFSFCGISVASHR